MSLECSERRSGEPISQWANVVSKDLPCSECRLSWRVTNHALMALNWITVCIYFPLLISQTLSSCKEQEHRTIRADGNFPTVGHQEANIIFLPAFHRHLERSTVVSDGFKKLISVFDLTESTSLLPKQSNSDVISLDGAQSSGILARS
jgi:hypothetical protein